MPVGPTNGESIPLATGSALTDQVRASCAAVARRAHFVHLNTDALPGYARRLDIDALAAPTIDPAYHVLADPATTVAYFLTLDTINFGSGYFPQMRKRPGHSGYYTIAASLKDAFEREGPWRASVLAAMTPERCAAVFGQDPAFPLMPLFAQALRDLGRLLLERYDG